MIYLQNYFLLPSISAQKINEDMVKAYFDGMPTAANLTADILSDNLGYNDKIPFGENTLLVFIQRLISKNKLSDGALKTLADILNIIDFKFSLIYFVQIGEKVGFERFYNLFPSDKDSVFLNRLNTFLAVLTTESLCLKQA